MLTCCILHNSIYKPKHNGEILFILQMLLSVIYDVFFLTPAVSHVQQCEVITQDLTNDVLVFVQIY